MLIPCEESNLRASARMTNTRTVLYSIQARSLGSRHYQINVRFPEFGHFNSHVYSDAIPLSLLNCR